MKTFLKSAQNQSLSSEICSGSSHEIGRSLPIVFQRNWPWKFPRNRPFFSTNLSLKIPRNLTFFSATYQKPWLAALQNIETPRGLRMKIETARHTRLLKKPRLKDPWNLTTILRDPEFQRTHPPPLNMLVQYFSSQRPQDLNRASEILWSQRHKFISNSVQKTISQNLQEILPDHVNTTY